MWCLSNNADLPGQSNSVRIGRWQLLSVLLFLVAMNVPASGTINTNGPTIHLRYGAEEAAANPVAEFMYFVPLISPTPVTNQVSHGNTQSVRMISSKSSVSRHSFTATCELELSGDGRQQNSFDLGPTIHRNKQRLQKGGSLQRQLKSIAVQGAGAITVEVKGAITNEVATVNEVRLHFNARGHVSPVWIDLCDIRRIDGDFQPTNEIVARVNTLTFRRKSGPAKMEVSVSTIKAKDSGNSFWANLEGHVAGLAVNMFIPPLTVEAVGHRAMLDFGQALISGAPTFTFPKARNLRTEVAP